MKTRYEFIHFDQMESKGKTLIFSCRNNKSDDELGRVGYLPGWRQYIFIPNAATIFSAGCLKDIQDFIIQIKGMRVC